MSVVSCILIMIWICPGNPELHSVIVGKKSKLYYIYLQLRLMVEVYLRNQRMLTWLVFPDSINSLAKLFKCVGLVLLVVD